jgi:protein SCO1
MTAEKLKISQKQIPKRSGVWILTSFGFWILLFGFCSLVSCGEKNNNGNGEIVLNGIPRLSVYYPLDSTDANGRKVYHTISERNFLDQSGKIFTTSSMKGKVVVSDFFFASCAGTCPRMTNQLVRVQNAFRGNTGLALVSYTVDPARDSVPALQEYASRFKADTAQWKFITGDKKSLYDLARYDYFLPVEPGNGDSEDFIHSDQLILLDRQSRIRGYYSGTDSAAVDSLIVDIRTLLDEK